MWMNISFFFCFDEKVLSLFFFFFHQLCSFAVFADTRFMTLTVMCGTLSTPIPPLHWRCSKDDVKMSPSCSTILLLVHLSPIPAAECKGSRRKKSAPNIILEVGNSLLPSYKFPRKQLILGAINERSCERDASFLLGSGSFVLAAAEKVK